MSPKARKGRGKDHEDRTRSPDQKQIRRKSPQRTQTLSRLSSRFWKVADLFRLGDPHWIPENAGYELRHILDLEASRWLLCLKIHVITHLEELDDGSWIGNQEIKSSVTIWPQGESSQQRRSLAGSGFYDATATELVRLGYDGKWSRFPLGLFGDFWKDLTDPADVRRELKLLERLPSALASAVGCCRVRCGSRKGEVVP